MRYHFDLAVFVFKIFRFWLANSRITYVILKFLSSVLKMIELGCNFLCLLEVNSIFNTLKKLCVSNVYENTFRKRNHK